MKKIISTEETCYAGDSYHTLYIDRGIDENLLLCFTREFCVISCHLTSDEKYIEWLYTHAASLFIIPESSWYKSPERTDGGKYHWEFIYTFNKLKDMNIK